MLNCEGFSFGRYCNTYNHNLPKRRVNPVKVHMHIISPFGIVLPIEMRRLSQMHGIEFIIRVVARNLRVVVGHFLESGVSVLGLLLLDHLLEELLCHLLGLLRLLGLSSLLCRLLCRIITFLESSSLESESESELDEESLELSTMDGVRLGALPVRSATWASLSSLS
jgi:hypothetical protein